MNKTFNTVSFGKGGQFGGHMPVWARVENNLVSGGHFNLEGTNPLTNKVFAPGDLIPAGTMLKYSAPGGVLTIVPNDAESVEGVKGLLQNDVLIPEGCVLATGSVVTKGRIYADRVYAKDANGEPVGTIGLPEAVEALLPMIEFVREG